MPQYELTIDDEMLHGLFQKDEGLPKLLEAVLNQTLEAQVTDHLKAVPYAETRASSPHPHACRCQQ